MSRPTLGLKSDLRIRDYHPLWFDFPVDSTFLNLSHWPGPRSLATTNGVSFDVLSYRYLDVSVPCVCFLHPILFRCRYLYLTTRKLNCLQNSLIFPAIKGGLPHSEIYGSKVIRTSPQLIAAYHVLHRLCMPRHPPNALKTLDRSHCQYSFTVYLVQNKQKYQQKRPASRDIPSGAVKLPIISKGFEHSLATQCFFFKIYF